MTEAEPSGIAIGPYREGSVVYNEAVYVSAGNNEGGSVWMFAPNTMPAFTMTVTKIGMGGGMVTSKPSGINCGTACGAEYRRRNTHRPLREARRPLELHRVERQRAGRRSLRGNGLHRRPPRQRRSEGRLRKGAPKDARSLAQRAGHGGKRTGRHLLPAPLHRRIRRRAPRHPYRQAGPPLQDPLLERLRLPDRPPLVHGER